MNPEIIRHTKPLAIIFIVFSLIWIFFKVPYYQYIFLLFGFGLGAFFLDIDHLVYWLYLNPNIEESRLAAIALKKYDFRSIAKLIEATQATHTNLIFHHFFFQVVLALISVFVFTSSGNVFGMAFLLAVNIHLLVDEYEDFRHDPQHLQDWLFARETKQLPVAYLGRYLAGFAVLSAIFALLLFRSAL